MDINPYEAPQTPLPPDTLQRQHTPTNVRLVHLLLLLFCLSTGPVFVAWLFINVIRPIFDPE